jgi:superfamily II DNA or RNA helicase
VIATGKYVGEGFDDPRLDTLFLAMPIAWRGTLVQYAGRLQRRHAGKKEIRVHDYVDASVPVLAKMLAKRLRGYRALGFEQGDRPAHILPREHEVDYSA